MNNNVVSHTGSRMDSNIIKTEEEISVNWSTLSNNIDWCLNKIKSYTSVTTNGNDDVTKGFLKSLGDIETELIECKTKISKVAGTKNTVKADDEEYTVYLECTYFVELKKCNINNLFSNITVINKLGDK